MGQRSQIIIITSPAKWPDVNGKPNPNNNDGRIYVFHNQWLYGHSFIRHAMKWHMALQEQLEYSKNVLESPEVSLRQLEDCSTVACALSSVPTDVTRTRYVEEYSEEYKHMAREALETGKHIEGDGLFKAFLDRYYTDNNNGYIIFMIGQDGTITHEIRTGREDDEEAPRHVTATEYISNFYDVEEMQAADPQSFAMLQAATVYLEHLPSGGIAERLLERVRE